jgi:hypothetical protein
METGLWVLEADYPSVSRAEIQLQIRMGGPGGTLLYDSTTAYNIGLAPYLVWDQSGDTLWPDATGKVVVAQIGALNDSLVWHSMSGNPQSVGKAFALGSGLFPKDTLVADYAWSTREYNLPWSVLQSDRAWLLQFTAELSGLDWTLRLIDGRDVSHGTAEGESLSIEYPQTAGWYVLEASDALGRRWTQKLLRP